MNTSLRDQLSLDEIRAGLVESLRSRQLGEAAFAHVLSSVSNEPVEMDAQFITGMREVAARCVECFLTAIEQGEEWRGPVPSIVAVQARRAARTGVSLASGLHRYLAGSMLVWDSVLEEVGSRKMSDAEKMVLLRSAFVAMMSLLARLVVEIADNHIDELKRSIQTRRQRRAELVRRLLAGEFIDVSELGYELDLEHLGMIAFGPEAEKAVEVLARRLGSSLLLVSPEEGIIWAWLGTRAHCAVDSIESHLAEDSFPGLFLVIGEPDYGLAGFRTTHRLAQAAARVAQRKPKRITRYADVALEAHALLDHTFAYALVAAYLSRLRAERDGPTLLATLRVFYQAERNESKAARMLGAGRQTVIRRLRRIEQLIGRPLVACHAEIEVALRLDALAVETVEP